MPRIAVNAINVEEPEMFSRHVLDFLTAVDCGKWGHRGE